MFVDAEDKVPYSEKLKAQIATWQVRADMAELLGNEDLFKQATERMRRLRERLLKIQTLEDSFQ